MIASWSNEKQLETHLVKHKNMRESEMRVYSNESDNIW